MAVKKIKSSSMSAEQKRWRAESDARTLAEAQQILGDKLRKKDAEKAALRMAKDLQDSAQNLKLAAGGKIKR